jgi:hypothetical protein
LRLVASPDGAECSVTIYQDARLYIGLFTDDESAALALEKGRRAYVHVARGEVDVNATRLLAATRLNSKMPIAFGWSTDIKPKSWCSICHE